MMADALGSTSLIRQFLGWYLVVQVLALLALPLTLRVLARLPDRGYSAAKVAGILLEQEMAKGTDVPAFMLVGTGINIAHAPDGAVAINDVLASPVGVDDFRDAFLSALSGRYEIWGKDGFAPLRDDWLSHAHGVGGPVTARMAEKSVSGTFEGVDENGTLVMRDDHGEIRHISGAAIHFGGANS